MIRVLTDSPDEGKMTVEITYVGGSAVVQAALSFAARYLYRHGWAPLGEEGQRLSLEDLTVSQRLDIIDRYLKHRLVELGRKGKIEDAEIEAAATAQAEVDAYELE